MHKESTSTHLQGTPGIHPPVPHHNKHVGCEANSPLQHRKQLSDPCCSVYVSVHKYGHIGGIQQSGRKIHHVCKWFRMYVYCAWRFVCVCVYVCVRNKRIQEEGNRSSSTDENTFKLCMPTLISNIRHVFVHNYSSVSTLMRSRTTEIRKKHPSSVGP